MTLTKFQISLGFESGIFFFRAGYQFTHAGENLAVNFSDSSNVVSAWMESPGHRENILNGNFTEIGIAAAEGEYKGEDTIFVVQLFGKPLPFTPSVSGASEEPEDDSEQDSIQLTTEGPISDEESDLSGQEGVAPIQTETIKVTDVIESNDSLYIAVRDNRFSEGEENESMNHCELRNSRHPSSPKHSQNTLFPELLIFHTHSSHTKAN